ncbi:MAG: ArnT family glycosyltransferase [Calditrichaceae bacterium]
MAKKNVLLLILISLSIAFIFQGSRGLYETTEGRYAESAREMLETGNWLIPQLDYEPHWTKPPLSYWAIAAGIKLFGVNSLGARSANAFFYLLLIFLVYALGKTIWDDNTGYVSAIVFATSPFMIAAENNVSTDMILSFWELLTVFAYWKAVRQNGKRGQGWIVLVWLASGLGFLTKGPPALLSLLSIIVFHTIRLRQGRELPRLMTFSGIFVFIISAFSWYLYVVLRTEGLLDYFLKDEVVSRVFSDKFHRNPEWYKPVVIYLGPLFLGLIPWVFFWPKIKLLISPDKMRFFFKKKILQNEIMLFLFLWLLIPVVILSISRSRLPFYVLPFVPPLALVTGRGMVRAFRQDKLFRIAHKTALITGVVLIAGKGIAAYVDSPKSMSQMYRAVENESDQSTKFMLYHRDKLYGLQFYLNGKLERIQYDQKQDTQKRSPETVLQEIINKPEITYIIITDHRNHIFQDMLDEMKIPYKLKLHQKKYNLITIHKTRT